MNKALWPPNKAWTSTRLRVGYRHFVAINYDCMVPDNLHLPVPQRPFTREFLRTLYLTLEIMTNSKNNYHSRSPMKLAKGYKTFVLPKNFSK